MQENAKQIVVRNCSDALKSAEQVPNAAAHAIEKTSFALMLALVTPVNNFLSPINQSVFKIARLAVSNATILFASHNWL